MRHRRRRVGEQAVFRIVDQLALLRLLHLLDEQAELLLDLIEGTAVEVRDARLHVEHGGHRVQEVLARIFLVIDEGLRQIGVASRGGLHSTSAEETAVAPRVSLPG